MKTGYCTTCEAEVEIRRGLGGLRHCVHCASRVSVKSSAIRQCVRFGLIVPIIAVVFCLSMTEAPTNPTVEDAPAVATAANVQVLPDNVGEWRPPQEEEDTEPRITLSDPNISIQSAMVKICEISGLKYEWQLSREKTSPKCRMYVSVDLNNVTLSEALEEVVVRNGLHYCIQGNSIWLEL